MTSVFSCSVYTAIVKLNINLSWGVGPGQVGKVRVHRHTNNLTVYITKLIGFVTEGDDLCGANKSAAEWAEIKQHLII